MIQRCFAYLFQSGGRVQRNVFTRSSKWLIARRIQARANCKESFLQQSRRVYEGGDRGTAQGGEGEFERSTCMGCVVSNRTVETAIALYFLQTAIPHEGIP